MEEGLVDSEAILKTGVSFSSGDCINLLCSLL